MILNGIMHNIWKYNPYYKLKKFISMKFSFKIVRNVLVLLSTMGMDGGWCCSRTSNPRVGTQNVPRCVRFARIPANSRSLRLE